MLFCFIRFGTMGDDNTTRVDAELRSAVTETLKSLPGFEALMAEAAKRSTDANHEEGPKDIEDDKEKNGEQDHVTRTTPSYFD